MNFNILDQLFEPVIVIDRNKTVAYYNHYFSSFTKSPPRTLKKVKSLSEIFYSKAIDLEGFIDKALTNNELSISEEVDLSLQKSFNTSYIVVIKIIPFLHDKQQLFMICFHDLSIEKKLYDKYREQLGELKETHAQIIQADKLASIGELTAGISHEICNPLTIANGSTEILEMCLDDSDLNTQLDTMHSSIKDIKHAHARINSIILNMKNYMHKGREDKKEYCNLAELIENAIHLVKPSYSDANIALATDIQVKNPVALVNPTKIEQVIVNLLKNALDSIKNSNVPNGNVKITLSVDANAHTTSITVADNGPGVPADIRDNIFDTFFTTKNIGEGTGLGLSISSKIMETHMGTLTLEDTNGPGACFKMELPIIEVSSYAENEEFLNGIDAQQIISGRKILVVDNEVQVLNIFDKFCKEEGYVFVGSVGGQSALQVLEEIPIDLIITDYHMPIMNGSEFAKTVRERGFKCPIFYLTSLSNLEHFQQDKEKYQIGGLILKPFTRDEVIKTIKLALQATSEVK